MKTSVNIALASILTLSLGGAAIAQTRTPTAAPPENQIPSTNTMQNLPGAKRPGADPLQLLQQESVQKELNLTSSQVERLNTISQQARSSLQRSRSTSPADFQNHVIQVREQVAGVLEPQQLERLRQILLQTNGFAPEPPSRSRAANRQDPLRVSSTQQQQIASAGQTSARNLQNNATRASRTRSTDPNAACEAKRVANTPVLNNNQAQAVQVLTAQQRAQLEQQKGAPANLPTPPCASN